MPIQVGQQLALRPPPAIYFPGANAEVARLFPSGLSEHGVRYMANAAPPNDWASWSNESLLEAVRRAEHSDRPSRMTSVFAFETEEDSLAFANTFRAGMTCAIVRLSAKVGHRGNMSLLRLTGAPGAHSFSMARSYWKGDRGPVAELWELLLVPPVTVVDIVVPIVS
jgi:hypothetical protein